ncbi:MAG: hypothetical protein SGPRY_011836 [Prymnesium sp.]
MELFCCVPTDTRFLDFCTSHLIERPSNLKRATDHSDRLNHFAESFQDGPVLISDAAKLFYDRVVSKRVNMSDLYGSGNNPHQPLRKLMAGIPHCTHD